VKKYLEIDAYHHWNVLVPKIEPNSLCLSVRDNENFIIGWEIENEIDLDKRAGLNTAAKYIQRNRGNYTFGYFGYDVKNLIENDLHSRNPDSLEFPDMYFFTTRHCVIANSGKLMYYGEYSKKELEEFLLKECIPQELETLNIKLQSKTSSNDYVKNVTAIQARIQRGDIYEMNYCIAFEATNKIENPFGVFQKLMANTAAPNSAYMRTSFGSIISASPERFLKFENNSMLSQPIKGTAPRGINRTEDDQLKSKLLQDDKEKSENIMIVDLVRNDLSKIAAKNSVHVSELCKLYTFNTVHQLISTVECKAKAEVDIKDIISSTFPMGSMTGAPKISAMIIAEQYENFKRGAYSGALGFFSPNGNFDFNVIIRSILYNARTQSISAAVGSAVTIKSDPKKEYAECLVKLEALKLALC
jgi:para-aminobenzoate synthetase component 1